MILRSSYRNFLLWLPTTQIALCLLRNNTSFRSRSAIVTHSPSDPLQTTLSHSSSRQIADGILKLSEPEVFQNDSYVDGKWVEAKSGERFDVIGMCRLIVLKYLEPSRIPHD